MASERRAPDALLVQTNLSGVVGDIQDDTDSPDANWLTAPGSNNETECRASFPTPTGNPTAGAGLQEFRALVRKTNHSTDPTVTLELYENGALVATLVSAQTVSSTSGVVIAGTWDASSLGTADGSLVEIRVVGTTGGGNPNNRASLEVGALEWNVEYTAGGGPLDLGSLSATATSSLSGSVTRSVGLSGSLGGGSSVGAPLAVSRPLSGSVDASSSISAALVRQVGLTGQVDGGSSLAAALDRVVGLQGSVSSSSSVGAILSILRALVGTLDGGSSLTGSLSIAGGGPLDLGAMSVDATSTLAATLDALRALSGDIQAASSLMGALGVLRGIIAEVDASSLVDATLAVGRALDGAIDGGSSFSATLTIQSGGPLDLGAISLGSSSSMAGDLAVLRSIAGTITSNGQVLGSLSIGLVMTPDSRVYLIDYEPRTYAIEPEDRTLEVSSENRTLEVSSEN